LGWISFFAMFTFTFMQLGLSINPAELMNNNSIDKIYTIANMTNCRAGNTRQFPVPGYRCPVLVKQLPF
jgi:hypothetical protein